jgi:hypothetical protein
MEAIMNCATCNAKIPTLARRQNRVNEALAKLGQIYHKYNPVEKIQDILMESGFEATSSYYSEFTGTCGASKGYSEAVGDGKWLHVSLYRMESGNYEIVAYVN